MVLYTFILAFFFAVFGCFMGEVIRMITPGLRRLLLPGSILGGICALTVGPQIFSFSQFVGIGSSEYGLLSDFPALFINVVFATLMLGRPIRGLSAIWQRANKQIAMGHVYAWGQYVVGLSAVLFILAPFFGVDPLAGATIAIGFQGGHGTAAGLNTAYESLGFTEGKTIAFTLATVGILAGAILGPVLANFHRRHQNVDHSGDTSDEPSEDESSKSLEQANDAPKIKFSPLTGSLTIHLAIIGLVILTGYGLLYGAGQLETMLRGDEIERMFSSYVPLFSVVLICGFIYQLIFQKLKLDRLLDQSLISRISSFSLDMVIFGALASLDLKTVGDYWIPIVILGLAGLSWNASVYTILGRKIYPHPWFAYGLGDLGGGTATTATGLLLIRVADPQGKTDANAAYTEKQPFYEPFMGGGLVTAFALPVIASLGALYSLALTSLILFIWIGIAVYLARNGRRSIS